MQTENSNVIEQTEPLQYLYAKASTYGHAYQKQPFFDKGTEVLLQPLMQERAQLEKYQEFVLAVPSQEFMTAQPDVATQDLVDFWEDEMPLGLNYKYIEEGSYFADTEKTLATNPLIRMFPRSFVEENMSFVQLVSVLVITDENAENIMVLHNTGDKIAMDNNTTLIQGHVAYDPSVYTMNGLDFLIQNVMKEYREEVLLSEAAYEIVEDYLEHAGVGAMFTLYSKHDLISLEHLAIVSHVELGNDTFRQLVGQSETNEEDNHRIGVIKRRSVDLSSCDMWTRMIIRHLGKE